VSGSALTCSFESVALAKRLCSVQGSSHEATLIPKLILSRASDVLPLASIENTQAAMKRMPFPYDQNIDSAPGILSGTVEFARMMRYLSAV
jgi:hypothetical protein